MRWVLGCLSIIFVVFGGCVLAVFSDVGVTRDEIPFVIGGALVVLFGIWIFYKAVTMKAGRAGNPR